MQLKKLQFITVIFLLSQITMGRPTFVNRLPDHLIQQSSNLNLSGSYSKCASLINRLEFMHISTTEMSARHMWNFICIMMLAINTLPSSNYEVVQWKHEADLIVSRLQMLYLPDLPAERTEYNHDDEVDRKMLWMVHHDLKQLLIPPHTVLLNGSFPSMQKHIFERRKGTTFMFLSLLEEWKAPDATIQLLARSYLPLVYSLHLVHDPRYLYYRNLLGTLYIPIHEQICRWDSFQELGRKDDFERAITVADYLHTRNHEKALNNLHNE